MRWQSNLILVLVLLALASWYYFYDVRGEKLRSEADAEQSRLFPGVSADSVIRFEIRRHAMTDTPVSGSTFNSTSILSFSRSADLWMMDTPVATYANTTSIASLISEIVDLKSQKKLEIESMDSVGLDKPAIEIMFTTMSSDGTTREHHLRLGRDNPSAQFLYANVLGTEATVLVTNSLKPKLTKGTDFYRDRRILISRFDTIQSIEFKLGDNPAIQFEGGADLWTITKPSAAPGDTARISEIANLLQSQEIQSFIEDNPVNLEKYGLNAPHLVIRVAGVNQSETEEIRVGSVSDRGGKFRFAHQPSRNVVFTVTEEFVSKFVQDTFTYRNKDVCSFERSEIIRITLDHSDSHLVIENRKDEDGADEWHCIEPRSIPTDNVAVGALLSDIAYLRGTSIKPDDVDFGEEFAKITLQSKASNASEIILTIGSKTPASTGRWIKSSGNNVIFEASDADISRLLKTEFDLRDKTLVKIPRDELESIVIENQTGRLSIKALKGRYVVEEPVTFKMDQASVDELAWSLLNVKMAAVVSESNDDMKSFGLDQPVLTIDIQQRNGTHTRLFLGKTTDDQREIYVSIKDMQIIASVKIDSISDLVRLATADFGKQTEN